MKPKITKTKVLLGVLFLFSAVTITYFSWFGYNVRQELRKQWVPEAKPVSTKRLSRHAPMPLPDGVKTFPYHAEIRDVLAFGDTFLLATDAGLVIAKSNNIIALDKTNGFPASSLSQLAVANEKVLALAPEGLLQLRGDWASPVVSVEIERFSPADGSPLIDLWTDGQTVLVLDRQGRILQFVENRFSQIGKAPPDPTAHLQMLNRQPVIGTAGGDLTIRETGLAKARVQSLWPKEVDERAILALAADQQGLLAGTSAALWRVDALGASRLLENFAVSAIALWRDKIWVGGPGGVVRDVAGEVAITLGVPIHRLRPDGARLLIATNDGLFAADAAGAVTAAVAADLLKPVPEGYISALATTGNRVLIGTLNRGLWMLNPDNPPARDARLQNLGINQIVPDGTDFYVATTNGLFQLDSGLKTRRRWTDKDGLPHRYVTSVIVSGDRLTVGASGGVARITPGGMQAIDAFHGLAGNQVYCLAPFGKEIAAGGLAGLSLLGGGDGLAVTGNKNAATGHLPHNWVNALLPDENRLYVGTYGGGIVVLDAEGSAQPLAETAKLSINSQAALRVGNVLLFGTLTQGLAASRDGRRWVLIQEPLLSPNVTALAASPGFLWVGGDRGLVRLPWETILRLLE